ncbi:MAG TPA: YceI family protein [Pyrinomonadaceae bacterium]|nr:YceI family protein [Pyrinomonadaceae bacterium]
MKKLLSLGVFSLAIVFLAFQDQAEALEQQFADRFANPAVVSEGEAGSYNFDRAHTFIGFRVKHMGLIDVPGYLRDFTGTITYDPKDPSRSSVNFSAKMTSIDTGIAGRDNHLRSADFFEVEKFPDLTFKSTKVEKKGDNWVVTGDLTIKETTRSVSMPFNITGFIPANQRSGPRMGVTAETNINRRDFGVTYGGNVPGTETPTIANDVKIWLQIEAIKPREETKPAEN